MHFGNDVGRSRLWPLFAVALLAIFSVLPGAAQAETRSLKLYFLHTGEKAIIAYKKDGSYIPSG
ncbi:MAG: hypothetical protein VYD64_03965, partial [Pseudomonadota bacterium]|nr:hypothetical protein [Pseudomonadota bacterium]